MQAEKNGTSEIQITEQKLRVVAKKIAFHLETQGILIASKRTPLSYGDYIDHIQTKDAELSHLRREVDDIIREHLILCPACNNVSILSLWRIVRGGRRDEALVINCPTCRKSMSMGKISDGVRIKDIVNCCAYALPQDLFKFE